MHGQVTICILKSACRSDIFEEGFVGTPVSQQMPHRIRVPTHGLRQAVSFMCEPRAVEKIVVNCFIGGSTRGAGWRVGFVDFVQEVIERNVPCAQLH